MGAPLTGLVIGASLSEENVKGEKVMGFGHTTQLPKGSLALMKANLIDGSYRSPQSDV